MKFEKLVVGMVLYDRHKYRAGNTTMRVLGEWRVRIISIDPEKRTAMASWNSNPPNRWRESDLAKLKTWSMYDECAERVGGMIGTIAVRKKKRSPPPSSAGEED